MICCIVGARPNFIKMTPVLRALSARGRSPLLVHTGQHYDAAMSHVFFDELGLPAPDVNLGVGSATHAEQTARVMLALEPILQGSKPDLVVVAGDVNSTLAAALTAAKLQIPVAHVEAGLRSFDREMPEELNRILTDHASDLLFTTEASGDANLAREGIARDKIFFVGNPMIDTLDAHLERAIARGAWRDYGLEPGAYGVVTLHRPSNVDDAAELTMIMGALAGVSEMLPLIFPAHPRTRARLQAAMPARNRIRLTDALGYLDFMGLMVNARLVLTDSGGIQEETTALGVPCLTLRENTERPLTLELGTNLLVGRNPEKIESQARRALQAKQARPPRPPLWDGHAGERIADVIQDWLAARSRRINPQVRQAAGI